MADILVVDDDQSIGTAFEKFLHLEGHQCLLASNAADALRLVDQARPDLVIMDVRMPGVDGLEALADLRRRHPSLHVVIMTAHGTSQTSIDAMRAGAFEYVTKPFDLEQLRALIARVVAASAPRDAAPPAGLPDVSLVGDAPAMRDLYKMIGTLASNDVPALIVGERGTGKELVASTIHRNSVRRDHAFVSVDCTTLPDAATEAEMLADGVGTLYLSEIHAAPRSVQARLSRMLGADGGRPGSGPRVIAACERDPESQIDAGTLSRELFELLSVITLRLPPLRARASDIPELVHHLVRRFGTELNRDIHGVDEQVLKRLVEHQWPGNVQELASVLKRAVIVSRGAMITLDQVEGSLRGPQLPGRDDIESGLSRAARLALQERLVEMPTGSQSSVYHDIVGFVETTLVKEALTITNGNQVKASELLGVNRATLRKKASLGD